jgi:hypothetical protein
MQRNLGKKQRKFKQNSLRGYNTHRRTLCKQTEMPFLDTATSTFPEEVASETIGKELESRLVTDCRNNDKNKPSGCKEMVFHLELVIHFPLK